MSDWLRDLHDKAGKFEAEVARWEGSVLARPFEVDAEYLAECSPERVRALCELADELDLLAAAYDHSDEPCEGQCVVERRDVALQLRGLLSILASLEPAHEEET